MDGETLLRYLCVCMCVYIPQEVNTKQTLHWLGSTALASAVGSYPGEVNQSFMRGIHNL